MAKAKKRPARKVARKSVQKPGAHASRQVAPPPRVILFDPLQSGRPDIDAMDAGLDVLLTVEIALSSDETWSDRQEVMALRGAIVQAMRLLRPVREQINALAA